MISLLMVHIFECAVIYIILKLRKKAITDWYVQLVLVFLFGLFFGVIIYIIGVSIGIFTIPDDYDELRDNNKRNRDVTRGVESIIDEKRTAKDVSSGYMWVCTNCGIKYNKYITKCEKCGRTKEAQKLVNAGGWECRYCKSGNPQNVFECINCKKIDYTIKGKIERAPYFYGAKPQPSKVDEIDEFKDY